MSAERSHTSEQTQAERGGQPVTAAELIDRLAQYDGPPQQFLINLLAVQSHLSGASGGAVLRVQPDRPAEVLAVYPASPAGATVPTWLAQAAEQAGAVVASGATAVRPVHGPDDLYGQVARQQLVMLPIRGATGVRGAACFLIETRDSAALHAGRERLELTVSLLSLYEMRLTLQRRQADIERLRSAMETLTAVNRPERFAGAAMAFCNEVSARWQCERASLGLLRGRYVRARAMSHTEKFSRKMQLVQDIEATMEECLDQDVEIYFPADPSATFVNRAAAELSKSHGPTAVLSLPLWKDGKPAAILTVERPADRPFALEETETLRLACDLCTPRLLGLHDSDRWIAARAVSRLGKGLGVLVGPKHTWVKMLVVALCVGLGWVIFGQGDYQAEAPFVLEAIQRQVIPAPFEGYLESVSVMPGDAVEAGPPRLELLPVAVPCGAGPVVPGWTIRQVGTVLATLDASDLRLQLAAAQAEQLGYKKQADAARRDAKTADEQIALANFDKTAAKLRLLEHRIRQARLYSPISGVVLTGELNRRIGAPVKTGDVLFEVAPLPELRADVMVPEDQIGDVRTGQEGELATASYPDRRIRFVVEHVNPVAEVVKQQNVFKVRVRLLEVQPWMRPGMEGVAKITIDRRSYAWLWTRRLVNWVRMKLWL